MRCLYDLNGDRSTVSCLVPAVVADGCEITTSEGLADGDKLSPVHVKNLFNQGAIQCGFCTPGMVVTSTALLRENPDPDDTYLANYLRGNYCRCTGYAAMIKAVQVAAQRMKEEKMSDFEFVNVWTVDSTH